MDIIPGYNLAKKVRSNGKDKFVLSFSISFTICPVDRVFDFITNHGRISQLFMPIGKDAEADIRIEWATDGQFTSIFIRF